MTNPNPSPQVVQLKIAELLGWTDLKRSPIDNRLWGLPPQDTVAELDLGKYMLVPNWPGSLDAARGLEVKDREIFVYCLHAIIFGYRLAYPYNISPYLLFATPLQFCLAWIMSEHGYKWVECAACEGKPERISGGVVGPITAVRCSDCSGKGGEFVKIEKGASGGKQKTDHS